MASSGVDYVNTSAPFDDKKPEHETENTFDYETRPDSLSIKRGDATHRQLKPRHIQLIGIGGTIGTALYVQIGHSLINGGPASLFIAFTLW
jgi:amino acid transporter